MSETTEQTQQPTTEPTATEPQGEPADKPLGENGERALKAEREARKAAETAAKELQTKLDEINRANETAIERATREANEAREQAEAARAEALRFKVAAKYGLTDDDADLFLTGSDAETLERQASALASRTPTGPKPDPSQGAKGGATAKTPADSFAEFFRTNMS